jgi:hypothetical protein
MFPKRELFLDRGKTTCHDKLLPLLLPRTSE